MAHADEGDVAEQSQFAYDDVAGFDLPSSEPYTFDRDGSVEADVGDLVEQRRTVSGAEDERRDPITIQCRATHDLMREEGYQVYWW